MAEMLDLERIGVDQINMLKWEIYDLNGSTAFTLADSATWEIRALSSGSVILSGSGTINNSDTDKAGNTIRTVSMTIDTHHTDLDIGYYYLILFIELSTQQTQYFRVNLEVVDVREIRSEVA